MLVCWKKRQVNMGNGMFGLLMVAACIKKTKEYFFTTNKTNKWHWNIMVKNCGKVDNIFCYFMLFSGVSRYIFKTFCISVGMVHFIGNAGLKFYHRQLFTLIHFLSYSSCKSIYFNINMSFPSLLNFLNIKQFVQQLKACIFNGF